MSPDDTVSRTPDIFIVGSGMVGVSQLTPEAEHALSKAAVVYAVHSDDSTRRILEQRFGHIRALDDLYVEGRPRRDTYSEIADIVLKATQTCKPVAFITYGHPSVLSRPTTLIRERAKRQGLRVKVLPAISALDTLLIDLELDPGELGLQIYEATDVVRRKRLIAADIPCMIWQIGATGTATYQSEMTSPNQVQQLVDHLIGFYPPSHGVTVARSATMPITEPLLRPFRLDSLATSASSLSTADTLYLPPVASPTTLAQRE